MLKRDFRGLNSMRGAPVRAAQLDRDCGFRAAQQEELKGQLSLSTEGGDSHTKYKDPCDVQCLSKLTHLHIALIPSEDRKEKSH